MIDEEDPTSPSNIGKHKARATFESVAAAAPEDVPSSGTSNQQSIQHFNPHEMTTLNFCLILKNPYSEGEKHNKTNNTTSTSPSSITDPLLQGRQVKLDPENGFSDDDFLNEDIDPKVLLVCLLLRLRARGVTIHPAILGTVETVDELDASKNALYVSPDGDQTFILLAFPLPLLQQFAEFHKVQMPTNPYSFLGGASTGFTQQLEEDLSQSVATFMLEHPDVVEERFSRVMPGGYGPWGFQFEMPQRERTAERLLKTPWDFGGCGVQIDEMIRSGILIQGFYPTHSNKLAANSGLEEWARFRSIFTCKTPVSQPLDAIRLYFGEKVALYFLWMQHYTMLLSIPALAGLGMGIYGVVVNSYNNVTMSFYSLAVILWSVVWLRYWQRQEAAFTEEYGTAVEVAQEMVRDEFVGEEVRLSDRRLYTKDFFFPLTLYHKPDGTLIEKVDRPTKRRLYRLLLTYPVTIGLVVGLCWSLWAITEWRFKSPDNATIQTYASTITVVVMVVFGWLFDYIVSMLNDLENNRTQTEHEDSLILKSFLFYFCNAYSALFILLLYPHDSVSRKQRLEQLSSQLTMILIVKPAIQNISELAYPIIASQLRLRSDVLGSYKKALVSLLFCRSLQEPKKTLSRRLWKEGQLEPYTTTTSDYLEIAIQYGYMSMFASCFPWGPVAALIYNIIELRLDAKKVLHMSQRARPVPVTSIGSWNHVFRFLVASSILCNSYILCFLSDTFQDLGFIDDDAASRARGFVVVQYVFLGAMFSVFMLLPSVPAHVSKSTAKKDILYQRFTTRIAAATSPKMGKTIDSKKEE
eukprot:PhM_4_TR10409/c0_g1_i1/m.42736